MGLSQDQTRIKQLCAELSAGQRSSLIEFAEFLLSRSRAADQEPAVETETREPLNIPRPAEESVINAIRRLSKTYPMLDRASLLDKSSGLMGQHVMQGRAVDEVISDLEKLFSEFYEKHKNE